MPLSSTEQLKPSEEKEVSPGSRQRAASRSGGWKGSSALPSQLPAPAFAWLLMQGWVKRSQCLSPPWPRSMGAEGLEGLVVRSCFSQEEDLAEKYLHLISGRKINCYRRERQMSSSVRSNKDRPVTLLQTTWAAQCIIIMPQCLWVPANSAVDLCWDYSPCHHWLAVQLRRDPM